MLNTRTKYSLVALAVIAAALLGASGCLGRLPYHVIREGEYVVTKCRWYDENRALLAFRKPGEAQRLRIGVYDVTLGTLQVIYDAPFSVDYSDDILLSQHAIGYQSTERALVFDRTTGTLTKELEKGAHDQALCYSEDMAHLALVRPEGLYVRDTTGTETLVDTASQYASLVWAQDNSRLAYITNDYSDVAVVDLGSRQKRIFLGGRDFEYPVGLVDLAWCLVLPNSMDILIGALCEDNDALIVLSRSESGDFRSVVIGEKSSVTVMAAFHHLLLYVVEEGEKQELVCYDYVGRTRRRIQTSADYIVGADFSPDGSHVLSITFTGREHRVYTLDLEH